MAKKKKITYDINLLRALKKLPNLIEDKRHGLSVFVKDGKARSNQTRFEHIVKSSHNLHVADIEMIPIAIKEHHYFIVDSKRKRSCSYIYPRSGQKKDYLQVVINLDKNDPKKATIKTVFITRKAK